MVGVVHDLTDRRAHEREHQVAETLQRALLPRELPTIDGLTLSAQYVPAEAQLSAGGDWYDVVPLGDGRVTFAIGDVAGHGLRAASLMGQLRMAIRALALEGSEPHRIASAVNQLLVRDAERRDGHDAGRRARHVHRRGGGRERRASAADRGPRRPDGVPGGSSEHPARDRPRRRVRGGSLAAGGERHPRAVHRRARRPLRSACRRWARASRADRRVAPRRGRATRSGRRSVHELVPERPTDDVAVLLARIDRLSDRVFRIQTPANPHELASIRARLRRWLLAQGVHGGDLADLVAGVQRGGGERRRARVRGGAAWSRWTGR